MPTKDLQTPFDDYSCPMPGMDGEGTESRGGFDIPDGRKETENSESGLPTLPTTVSIPDGPGAGANVGMPALDRPGRTIDTK